MTGHSLIAPIDNPRARQLYSAAVILLALLPVAMVIANRSSIAFLVASTLCALGGAAAERRIGDVVRDLRSALAAPLGLAALAFLAWSALSLLWSGARPTTLHFLGEFWLPVGSALLLSLILPQRLSRAGLWLIAGALVLGCAIILVELALGLDHRRALGARAAGYIFNRSTVTILTLAIPVLAGPLVLAGARERAGALVLFASVAAVAMVTESGAGALGFLVEALRELGVEARGSDISSDAISLANPSVRPYLSQGDLSKGLPFEDGSFELISAFEILEHVAPERVPEALAELARVCKGHVLATIPSFGPNPSGPGGWFQGKVRWPRVEHYISLGPEYDGPVPFYDLLKDADGRHLAGVTDRNRHAVLL